MRACQCRNPIFCILPGFILKSVIEKGTPEQRQAALATLSSDSSFRAMRAYLAASNPPAARRRRRIGLGPAKHRPSRGRFRQPRLSRRFREEWSAEKACRRPAM